MIPISDAEKAKWESGRYTKALKLEFPKISLTINNSDIYAESMTLKESLFDGNDSLVISGCVSSCFSVEIRHVTRRLKGLRIVASIRIDNGSWLKLFDGYVDSVETVRDRSYMKLTCYDALQHYGSRNVRSAYNQLSNSFTVKQLRNAIFTKLGITQKTQDLINDNVVLYKNIEATEIAAIDAIKDICKINGVFGLINRDGQFEYRTLTYYTDVLPYPSDELFPADDLFPGEVSTDNHEYIDAYSSIKYEDYVVEQIDKVTVRTGPSDTESGTAGEGDNAYVVEGNMFLDGIGQQQKQFIALRLLDNFLTATYIPFDAEVLGRPYIEVGDSVSLYVYDYSSGQPETVVMTFNVLTRTLKGIQWLRDDYSASGAQYQPEVKYAPASNVSQEVDSIKSKVEDLESNKQNYIDADVLVPAGSATEGDLRFHGVSGNGHKQLYRYENGSWVLTYPVNILTDIAPATNGALKNIVISNVDIGSGATLEAGTLYLVVN